MRKLVVTNIMSLDGYYTGPGGDVMVMPFDESFDTYNAERLRNADTLLLGRESFEGFKDYWHPIERDPDAPAVAREISRLNNAIEKVVVSDTLTPDRTAPWDDVRIVPRVEAAAAVARLKDGPGRDVLVFGSRTMWRDLLAAGLVDELHLVIGAGVIGGGTPLFDRPVDGRLRLVDVRRFEGASNVVLVYEPPRGG
jgi:dihydrofolate reductase